MLKITNTETETEQLWTVSGDLVGPWVGELLTNWDAFTSSSEGKRRIVDLSQVTFIDEGGARVLRKMKGDGASFVASGVDTKHLLAGLEKRGACPLRRCLAYLKGSEK